MTDEDNVRALLDGLEEPNDIVDVQALSTMELLTYHQAIRKQLYELGEMLEPRTDKGRDLHSQRTACIIELRRRNVR